FAQALRLAPRDGDTLHNLGWMYCQDGRHADATAAFQRALQSPNYAAASRTWMTQGVCQARAGQAQEAEQSLLRSFELDAGNPITVYNLSLLLHQRGESERARFYLRRLNNSELANAESLWLGIKIENRLQNREAA
ncbi:tetratricopeptide repeat protein, partial [Aquabacterium sp. A08]